MNPSKEFNVRTQFINHTIYATSKENAISLFKILYRLCIYESDEITVSEPETLSYVTKEQFEYCVNNILCIFYGDLALASDAIITGYKNKIQINTYYIDLIDENIIANKN